MPARVAVVDYFQWKYLALDTRIPHFLAPTFDWILGVSPHITSEHLTATLS